MNCQKVGDITNNGNVSNINNNVYSRNGNCMIEHKSDSISKISLSISIISLIFSLISIGRTFYTEKSLEIDYMGVIVGILSLFIAFLAILLGYNIFSLENKIDKSVNKRIKEEMQNSISDTKVKLYYSASLINKESGQIELEFHNLFLSINECLKNNITTNDEYNIIQDRIYEIITILKRKERNFDITFKEPQLSNYIEISKKMIGEKSNEILQYLLLKNKSK